MTNTTQSSISHPVQTAYLAHPQHQTLQRPTLPAATHATVLRIFLEVGNEDGATLSFEIASILTIGRADPADNHMPDLDMTPHGGWDSGVSRHHAKITIMDKGLYITDRGSTNGTRVNGFILTPNLPYQLREGDTIEISRVAMILRQVQIVG